MTISDLSKEILVMGTDDWVRVGEIAKILRYEKREWTESAVMVASLAAMGELLETGLVQAGEVGEEGFQPWQLDTAKTIAHVEGKWISLGHPLGVDDLNIWLCNTKQGDDLGREYAPLFQDDDEDF